MFVVRAFGTDRDDDELWCSHSTLDRGEILEIRSSALERPVLVATSPRHSRAALQQQTEGRTGKWVWRLATEGVMATELLGDKTTFQVFEESGGYAFRQARSIAGPEILVPAS